MDFWGWGAFSQHGILLTKGKIPLYYKYIIYQYNTTLSYLRLKSEYWLCIKTILAGCRRNLIQGFENGSWDCPLMDPDSETIEQGLQCFAQCKDGFDLNDPERPIYNLKHFEKTCRCNKENGRCHWTKLDKIPTCTAARLNRIINGQTAEAHSKPYMVSVSVKPRIFDFLIFLRISTNFWPAETFQLKCIVEVIFYAVQRAPRYINKSA